MLRPPRTYLHRFITMLWLIIVSTNIFGQSDTVDLSKITLAAKIKDRCLFFSDSLDQFKNGPLESIPFLPFSGNPGRRITPRIVDHDVYLRFTMRNSADTAEPWYFMPGIYFDSFELFMTDSTGKFTPLAGETKNWNTALFAPLNIPANASRSFIARLRFVKTQVNYLDPRISRANYVSDVVARIRNASVSTSILSYVVSGILLMMILYSIAVYWLNKSIEFIYYAGYAASMALLFFLKAFLYKETTQFNYFFEAYLDFVIQSAGIYSYLLFIRRFTDSRQRFPVLDRVLSIEQGLTITVVLIFSYLHFFTRNFPLQDYVEMSVKLIWTLMIVFFVFYSGVTKSRYLKYLAVGNLLLLVFSGLSLYMMGSTIRFGTRLPMILNDSMFYYELGVTFELIFFLAALSFKNRNAIIERTLEQERLKLENERKEFEKQMAVLAAKQDERNRISADMHDELGSGVTAIRLMSEIVKTKMKEDTLPEINKISSSANDLIGKMNTIIWTMKSSNDSVDNLVAYTRAYALEYFENTGINCHFHAPETIPTLELNGEKRRNIFLCVKEALNNVVKHSKASDVWIDFDVDKNIAIRIRDNGVGVHPNKMREFGNGLQNMRKRMEDIEGNFAMQNGDGLTTTFTVLI
jgi:signal transduction histidine kinase